MSFTQGWDVQGLHTQLSPSRPKVSSTSRLSRPTMCRLAPSSASFRRVCSTWSWRPMCQRWGTSLCNLGPGSSQLGPGAEQQLTSQHRSRPSPPCHYQHKFQPSSLYLLLCVVWIPQTAALSVQPEWTPAPPGCSFSRDQSETSRVLDQLKHQRSHQPCSTCQDQSVLLGPC